MIAKRRFFKAFSIIVLTLAVISLLSSCKEPEPELSVRFRTPTITGSVSIPATSKLSPSDIWVKVIDSSGQTKNVSRVSSDGTFAVSGLKEGEKYDVYFTSEEPDYSNYNEKGMQSKVASSSGFGGWLGEVDAAINEGNDVGSVKMKPLGTIKGKALYRNMDEHYDIDVYIPGTSYIAKTAEDGSWAIYNVPQGTHRLRVTSTGYIAQMLENVNLFGPENDYETNPILVVSDTTLIRYEGSVAGKVEIAGESDLSGISVSLDGESADGDESVITAKDGTYAIPNVNPGTYKLVVQKAGYVTKEISGIVVRSSETYNAETVTLIKRTATVTGKITLSGQSDHSGTSLLLESSDSKHAYTATTDNSGSYRFSEIEPGTYTLYVTRDGYLGRDVAGIKVVSNSSQMLSSIKLSKDTGTVAGTVMLSGASDHSGIAVLLEGSNADGDEQAITSSDGTFTIPDVNPGSYTLLITKDGYLSHRTSAFSVSSDKITTISRIELSIRTATVRGAAKLEGRDTYEGIVVLLKSGAHEYSATTDRGGSWSVSGVEPGTYSVTVSCDGFETTGAEGIVVSSSANISVDLFELAASRISLAGSAKLSGQSDHSGIMVTATSTADASRVYTSLTNSDGTYTLSGLPRGTYRIEFSRIGYVSQAVNADTADGKVGSVELMLSTGTLQGKATLSGTSDHSGIAVAASGDGAMYSATTEADGLWSIDGVVPGAYAVTYSKSGYLSDNSTTAEVEGGRATSVPAVQLSSAYATVRGSVKLEGSGSHEGVSLLLSSRDGSRQYTGSTDVDGAFAIGSVVADYYTLTASRDGYATKQILSVEVSAGTDVQLEGIVLPVAQRSVTGRMTLEGRDDHSGISLTATNVEDPSLVYAALTNSEGTYSFAGMKPGEYTISASSAGYVTAVLPTVDVKTSSVSSMDAVELKIARGTIAGIAKLEGRADYSGIVVELVGTEHRTTTDETGAYSFSVPSGNYGGGVRFSHGYYESASDTETITVMTNGTYGVPAIELECLYADVVGKVDVMGTDDNGNVSITIGSRTAKTDADGSFAFEKVPLGSYTLVLERENTPKTTSDVEVVASEVVDLGTYTMIPNSASISGTVNLDEMTDNSGILVTASGSNGSILTAKTEESGYFYISNLISSASYEVSFSKEGWDSPAAIAVTGLQSLEERNITEDANVVMYDTTEPAFEGVVINTGVGTTSNRVVTIHLSAEDKGSGIAYMQVCTDNVFDRTVTMRDYLPQFEYELENVNGDKTVYVKLYDASDNASVVKSATVTLTDQKKEVLGVLKGDDLHWTKAKSPYYVTGNLMVEEGDVLTIDPGVDVQFAGAYSLTVRGELEAVGTADERISIYGVEDGVDKWEGIRFEGRTVFGGTQTHPEFVSGSRMSYADITGNKGGISGTAWLDNVKVEAESFALGDTYDWSDTYIERYFTGIAVESEFNGDIAMQKASVYDSTLSFGTCYNDDYDGRESYYQGSVLEGETMQSFYGINNKVSVDSIAVVGDTSSCTFIESKLSILKHDHFSNSYEKCSFSEFRPEKFEFNNMNGCDAIATMHYGTGDDDSPEVINMRNCFWGYDKTRELKTGVLNMSFIDDYYDGDFDKSKIDYSWYSEEPYPFAGFVGESYLFMPGTSVDTSGVDSHVTVANDRTITTDNAATINLSIVGDEEYSQYRIFSYSSDSFKDDNWKDVNGTEIEFMFDPDANSNLFDHYIQFRDEEGKETAVYAISIGLVVKGPSGGYIFHDKGYVSDSWRYMEADSEDYTEKEWVVDNSYQAGGYWRINEYFIFGLYRKTDYGTNLYVNGKEEYSNDCTSTGIGTGKKNTEMLVEAMGDYAYSELEGPEKTDKYAAKLCYDYEKNGYDDWFLPSRDELNQMYERLYKNSIGSFSVYRYWSSSENNNNAYHTWSQDGSYGTQINDRYNYDPLRPCRAF